MLCFHVLQYDFHHIPYVTQAWGGEEKDKTNVIMTHSKKKTWKKIIIGKIQWQ
jgi:hypothetical protein